jgi:hypothetical protein
MQRTEATTGMSGAACDEKPKRLLALEPHGLGQSCPQDCPQGAEAETPVSEGLGDPLSIHQVACIIGCSVWTVRQRCLRQGLPHFRASRSGKLIFYRNQVVRWLIEKQNERRW